MAREMVLQRWWHTKIQIEQGNLSNTLLITLPGCRFPDQATGTNLGRSMDLVKLSQERKRLLSRNASKLLFPEDQSRFSSMFSDSDWVIQFSYKRPFDFVDFMDTQRERIVNTIHTLMVLVALDCRQVWILRTDRSARSDQLVMALPLSDSWILKQEYIMHGEEREILDIDRLKLFNRYRRRLGTLWQQGGSALDIATRFYIHHLTLTSTFMRLIALSIVLEALFNIPKRRISRTIGRSVANLIAESPEEKERIAADVMRLYNVRSGVVHASHMRQLNDADKLNEVELADLYAMHNYARTCLRRIIENPSIFRSFLDNESRIEIVSAALDGGFFESKNPA